MSKDEKKTEHHHQGSTAAEDDEFSEWLAGLWLRKESPERLELIQVFGKYRDRRGEMIFHEDFTAGETLDNEQANKLANRILKAAQNDTDGLGKESAYVLLVIDTNRKATPLVRRIGPLLPKRKVAIASLSDGEEDDDEQLNSQNLALRYVQENFAQVRWDKTRYDHCVGHFLALYEHRTSKQDEMISSLMGQVFTMFQQLQNALNDEVHRKLMLKGEERKDYFIKEGMRVVGNVLPGLLSKDGGTPLDPSKATSFADIEDDAPKKTREWTLVDNFLRACTEEQLEIALFGDYDKELDDSGEPTGKLKLVTPGIFSVRQYAVLLGVQEGKYPISAVDNLMPDSGHKDAVTMEQLMNARQAGVTESMILGLTELIGMRQSARKAREAAKERTNGAPQEETQQ